MAQNAGATYEPILADGELRIGKNNELRELFTEGDILQKLKWAGHVNGKDDNYCENGNERKTKT
ncbi:hypothetical protein J437_LFUL014240 [Ladona fulva]|uniref:Uncharacterized protein n=1 Tax=Ladona fulva TaxID=123851 RepID=A0A8K0P8F4_LADFU|nr:hypothetical protein J437_LFUL014240 [Ladona fulva]